MYACTVLEITVSHWPFSDQFEHLADKSILISHISQHFQWASSKIAHKISNLKKTADQFLILNSGTENILFVPLAARLVPLLYIIAKKSACV